MAEVFTMMDSTDFEEHIFLTALEDTDHEEDDAIYSLQKQKYYPPTKTLSTMSTATAATAMMDEEDIDNFFFGDVPVEEGVEMVIDEERRPPARVLEMHRSAQRQPQKQTPPAPKAAAKVNTPKKTEVVSSKNKTKKNEGPVRVGIPGKFDVLCGQSRICASHTGNRRFQVLLDIYSPRYDDATSKQEKMTMTKEIVSSIHQAGGRFLKYKDGQWEEISIVTARDKTSHALRTKVASWKRQQQEKKKGSSSRRSSTATTSRPSHRRGGIQKSRRLSDSSVLTSASDIVTTSFDGNDTASANIMNELMKAQKQIFANLTTRLDLHPLKKSSTRPSCCESV